MILQFSVLFGDKNLPVCSLCKKREAQFSYEIGVQNRERNLQYCCLRCAKKLLGQLWDYQSSTK